MWTILSSLSIKLGNEYAYRFRIFAIWAFSQASTLASKLVEGCFFCHWSSAKGGLGLMNDEFVLVSCIDGFLMEPSHERTLYSSYCSIMWDIVWKLLCVYVYLFVVAYRALVFWYWPFWYEARKGLLRGNVSHAQKQQRQ